MAGDTYTMKVGSNIKQVTQDIDGMTSALEKSESAYGDLNDQVNIQKSVIIDLEKEYIELEAIAKKTPKTASAGYPQLIKKIQKAKTEIALEKNGLKDLNQQRSEAKGKIDAQTKALKKQTTAQKKGNVVSKTAAGVSKKLGFAMKMIPIMIIVTALKFLWDAMMKNKTIMDAVTKVTTIISNLFSDFVSVLVDTYKWVTESSDRFDALGKVMKGLMTIALTPLKLAFYALKLAVQSLMLTFYKLKNAWPGNNESAKIKQIEKQMKATNNEMKKVAADAIQAGKDIATNVGEAANELGAIYTKVSTGIKDISIDATKRVEEDAAAQVQATKDAAAEKLQIEKDNAQAIADFRNDLNNTMLDQQADTDEKRLQLERERHLAELDLLTLNMAEKKELTDMINAQYDEEAKMLKEEKDAEEGEILRELEEENMLANIENLKERALKELELEYEDDIKSAKQHGNYLQIKEQLDIKYAAAQKALDIKKKTWDDVTTKQKLTMASDAFGSLSDIMGKETKAGKAAAIGQATIQTYLGATSAFTSLSAIPIVGPVLGGIAAAAAVVSGFKNIKSIQAGSESPPDVPTPDLSVDSAMDKMSSDEGGPAAEMMSGKFDLGNVGGEPDPIKAFVVTDEMTDSQDQLQDIRNRSTI